MVAQLCASGVDQRFAGLVLAETPAASRARRLSSEAYPQHASGVFAAVARHLAVHGQKLSASGPARGQVAPSEAPRQLVPLLDFHLHASCLPRPHLRDCVGEMRFRRLAGSSVGVQLSECGESTRPPAFGHVVEQACRWAAQILGQPETEEKKTGR